jgi:hypothetical protein
MKNISLKHITLVLIATLTLALLVYAQSRTPLTQKGTAAPHIATQQDAQKAIQQGVLGQLATKANNSLRSYPSAPQISKVGNSKNRRILERGRSLLEAGKAATSWNATQLTSFANQLDQYLKDAEATVTALKNNGDTDTTDTEKCGLAKDRCNQRCHNKDAGYWCFVDCRLEYLSCLAGTIFGIAMR